MTIDAMLTEIEGYTTNANVVKELVIAQLHKDKLLTTEQANEYLEKWQVIVVKKSWFATWWSKFHNKKEDGYIYKFVCFEPNSTKENSEK